MMQCWSLDPADRPNASDVTEILRESDDLITPCLCEPLASIAHEDLCRTRIPTPQTPNLNARNGSTGGGMHSTSGSLDIMAGLGRLRASFSKARKQDKSFADNFREMELAMHAECSSMGRKSSGPDDASHPDSLSAVNHQRSTISVISSTFNYSSSCTSLDQLPNDNSTGNVRSMDSGSSSGIECNQADGFSPDSTGEEIRKSSTDEVMFGSPPDQWNPRNSVHLTMDDDLPLIPEKTNRSSKRSRSRSEGFKLANGKTQLKATTSVNVTLPEDSSKKNPGFVEDNTTFV